MLSNITLTNKTTIDPNTVKAPSEDITLSDGTRIKIYKESPGPNPIMFGRLNARDNPTTTQNTLIINIDNKDYLTSELSAVFYPGKAPVTFNVKDLIELDSVVKDAPLYDVVLDYPDDNTLEILGGNKDFSKETLSILYKDKTEEELKQIELEYKEKNKDFGIQGFDIGGIKINNTGICCNSLELFTDNNMLKAKVVFTISSIKFSGEDVTTEATYYKEKEPNVYRYTFKPSKDLITEYKERRFYIDKSVMSDDEINKKIAETVSLGWELYSIEVVVDS